MVKIGVLLPEEEMRPMATKIIEEKNLQVAYLKVIQNVDAVNEARRAVESGSHILVARGYQARVIQEYTNIPLVEIRFHGQEIGLLIQQAKQMVKKEHPTIGLIAFENMLCDLSHMGELLSVNLIVKNLNRLEEREAVLREISSFHPDVIIGGKSTCETAERMGYPTLCYRATEESLEEALRAAEQMAFAAESEKQNEAQFETVLDTSFNGIIKVNAEARIIVINKLVENLLGRSMESVVGLPIREVFPSIEEPVVSCVLDGKRENYTTSVSIRDQVWMLSAAPIQYDERITGAILSLQRLSEENRRNRTRQSHMVLHGYEAKTTFKNLITDNRKMQYQLEKAARFALSESPILIYGKPGLEEFALAEAIHNNSNRKAAPFVSFYPESLDKEEQLTELFGREKDTSGFESSKGAMVKADGGTLYIKKINRLALRAQYQILRTLLSKSTMRTDSQSIDNLNVRIVAESDVDLRYLVEKGEFLEEFYYLLNGLVLEIPSLAERPEDLTTLFEKEMKQNMELYNKRLKIEDEVYQKILEFPWEGNRMQLKAFCERLVLDAEKRGINAGMVEKLYQEMFPKLVAVDGDKKLVIYKSPESLQLTEMLQKFHGNRNLVAKELGISTTTLWRKMKKYGIE